MGKTRRWRNRDGALHDLPGAYPAGNTAGRETLHILHCPEAGLLPADHLQRDTPGDLSAHLRLLGGGTLLRPESTAGHRVQPDGQGQALEDRNGSCLCRVSGTEDIAGPLFACCSSGSGPEGRLRYQHQREHPVQLHRKESIPDTEQSASLGEMEEAPQSQGAGAPDRPSQAAEHRGQTRSHRPAAGIRTLGNGLGGQL